MCKKQQSHVAPDNVVGIAHNISSQSKITYLHHFPTGHEYIPGCQVSVDTL